MDLYVLSLRLIHIVAAVFWAGSLAALLLFIQPAAQAERAEGNRFMMRLMSHQGYGRAMGTAAVLAVAAGWLLYVKYFGWGPPASRAGKVIGLGGFAGTAAWILAASSFSRIVTKISPTAPQEEHPYEENRGPQPTVGISKFRTWILVGLLAIATAAMAVAYHL